MKFRVGACALMFVLAGCSGESPESSLAGMRDAASSRGAAGKSLISSLPAARPAGTSVANAPDRGALISYASKDAASRKEGAFTYYPVAISEEHALKAIVSGEMTVPSPDGSQVKLRYERHEEHADGNWTWVGRAVDGDQMQEAIITFGEKAVFGSIPQANGAPPLELVTRGGKLLASVIDPSKATRAISKDGDTLIPPSAASRAMASAAVTQSAVAQNAVAVGAPPTSANTIDLAIGYSNGLATRIGSDSGAVTRLTNLVQVANQALSNSDVNGYFRLVHAVKITYTDTTTNADTLQKLTGSTGSAVVSVPAALAPLRTARDQYGADLAILVRDFKTPENDGCGIAWLNGANRTAINPSVDAAWGYAVVSDGEDQGTDGKTYFCAAETLAHEAAHLMGSAHDRANSRDGNNLRYGAFDYSFGYKTDSANGNFYTVMAYGDTGQTPYRIFSTPLKTTCGGRACGVANSEDNARSLNQTIPVVAQFRATVVPFGKPRHDVDNDGRTDLLFHASAAGRTGFWLMNGAARTGNAEFAIAAGYRVAATGDFNGDGMLDLVWTSNARDLWMWPGNANRTFGSVAMGYSANGWEIVGAGDVNGDGRADLLWHNASSGRFGVWLMSGATATQMREYPIAAGYRIVASGDFNGDDLLDVIWTSNARDMWMWPGINGGGFGSVAMGYHQPNWQIVGAGDIDGDGKSDLLWHNPATGRVGYWLMNGAVGTSSREFGVAIGYTMATYGDFNGDGLLDLVWTSAANDVWLWPGNASGGFDSAFIGYRGAGWDLIGK